MPGALLAAVKELAFHVRSRLEIGPPERLDFAAIEALIVLQKAIESAETDDPAVSAAMIEFASELLLETDAAAPSGDFLARWMARIDPSGELRSGGS